MTYFSRVIDKYFLAWILPELWCTPNSCNEDSFYRFVIMLYRLSKRVRPRHEARTEAERFAARCWRRFADRHPRTYDESGMRQKIVAAVLHYHPGFTRESADKYARRFTQRAMDILECLRIAEHTRYHDARISNWEPPPE